MSLSNCMPRYITGTQRLYHGRYCRSLHSAQAFGSPEFHVNFQSLTCPQLLCQTLSITGRLIGSRAEKEKLVSERRNQRAKIPSCQRHRDCLGFSLQPGTRWSSDPRHSTVACNYGGDHCFMCSTQSAGNGRGNEEGIGHL
jgi:hypothetical protein